MLIVPIAALIFSIIGTSISFFVFYRTVIQEKFMLDVNVLKLIENPSEISEYNRVYASILFVNRSKLPISINSIKLEIDGDFFDDNEPRKYDASYYPVLIYKSITNDQNQKYYSDKLPVNINPLSSQSLIVSFHMPDYSVRRTNFDKPHLIIKTSREDLRIPIRSDEEGYSIDIDEWIIGST